MILQDARIDVPYTVVSINLPEDSVRHLSNLGLKVGSRLELISKTKSSALSKIDVSESQETVETLPLSELEVGQFAYIDNIFAVNEAKRRLMDMGLTRHTKIYLRKVAPLGDPIEISLRGYELTLRKSEAQMISVVKIDNQEEK